MFTLRAARFALVFLAMLTWASTGASADKRVALVIGNGAYQNAPRLPNPRNDAQDVAAALKRVGFDTIVGLDLDRAGMDDRTAQFARAARAADIALFYYSGHAMQFAGSNYLMPVDAKLADEADLRRLTKVDDIVSDLQQAKNLRMLVLDSCRNNPFADALRNSVSTRGVGGASRGLAKLDSPLGMIVAYATQSGRTAEDGTGRNSPFTTAFLNHIEAPDEIGTVFRVISADVYEATGHDQLPELSLSLIGEFYLGGRPQLDAAKAAAAAQAWAAIKDTTSLAMIDTFIRQYGDSMYGPFARARRGELEGQVALAKPETPLTPPVSTAKRDPLTRADVTAQFAVFGKILERVRTDYVVPPDENRILRSAIEAMRTALPSAGAVAIAGPVPTGVVSDPAQMDLNAVYDAALDILNSRPDDSDDARVVEAASRGLVAALDPHSTYLNAKAYSNMQTQQRGSFGGIGSEVAMADGLVKIVVPFDDSPSSRAGVRAGDIITHFDGAPVQGLSLSQAVEKMRGPVGSVISLTVVREGVDKPFDLSVTRDTVRVQQVISRVDGGNVGYIRIRQFNQQTADGLKNAVANVKKQAGAGLKGFVLDLRNNAGGLFDQVISAADQLLDSGDIVSTRGRKPENTKKYSAKPGDATSGKPLIVLINGATAAGAEIMVGALQDNKRATVLGTRSFGTGALQTIFPLGGNDGAVRLTTAVYYTPSGHPIQAKGIEPNIEVLQNVPADVKTPTETKGEVGLSGHLKGQGTEQGGSQSYVPPDPKDDKALNLAFALMRRTETNRAFPPK
jgi:carboxyl-terminal processing protease